MLKIAICDDNLQELARITNLIGSYQEEKKISLKYEVFSNAFELIDTLQRGFYDILLLDVMMPGINGMQAAHEIRTFDRQIKIVFLTNSPEFAVESYSVDAYYYLIKPATAERLFPILNRLSGEILKLHETLPITLSSGMMRIPFCQLEFLEVMNKKLFFHLTDGSVKELYGSLSDFETELLSRSEFIKVHRSYIVNMGCIQELNVKGLTTYSKQCIPISRLLYAQIRKAYMENLFAEKGVQ